LHFILHYNFSAIGIIEKNVALLAKKINQRDELSSPRAWLFIAQSCHPYFQCAIVLKLKWTYVYISVYKLHEKPIKTVQINLSLSSSFVSIYIQYCLHSFNGFDVSPIRGELSCFCWEISFLLNWRERQKKMIVKLVCLQQCYDFIRCLMSWIGISILMSWGTGKRNCKDCGDILSCFFVKTK
jgi:hypothetical protein